MLLLSLLPVLLMAQDPQTTTPLATDDVVLAPGVSRELARRRAAKLARIEYSIEFRIADGMEHTEGSLRLLFSCKNPGEDLVLDWGGEALRSLTVNGKKLDGEGGYRRVANHIVIPARFVRGGKNTVRAEFRSRVASTGTPLTSYRDTTDGKNYYYTLVVPADCHRLFPCFDQPDRKAIFGLELELPETWTAVTNEPILGQPEKLANGRKRMRFDGTAPLPTYLFAFAAGPFEIVDGPVLDFSDGQDPGRKNPLRTFVRASKKAALEAERIAKMHVDTVRWYEKKFATPYPFDKLDVVLCPGFPYGGMEHAGAIFYRESAIVFDHAPTESELLRRSTLIYHEVAHQWFGNLVTMPWFDELWLKEGFATWSSFAVLEDLEPSRKAWLRFHQNVKPRALSIDASAGTVPVFQELANLGDAKSAYGPIVYNKAPAVLRELEQRVGSKVFYDGVSRFLQRHAFSNASWKDLLKALEEAGAKNLTTWSRRWIESPGMPQVRASWDVDDRGVVTKAMIQQRSAQGWLTEAWPLRIEVVIARGSKGAYTLEREPATIDGHAATIPSLVGKPAPAWVLLNASDAAYGQFVPDAKSAAAISAALADHDPVFENPLLRAIAFRGLEEAVREAEFPPHDFVCAACCGQLAKERDAITFGRTLSAATNATSRYLSAAKRDDAFAKIESQLEAILGNAKDDGIELTALRTLARNTKNSKNLDLLAAIARGTKKIEGLELGMQDRFLCAAALFARGDASAIESLEKSAKTDVAKYAYQARAATPDASAKASVFESYLKESEPPEQWITGSLSFFHWPGQSTLTLPYLERALDSVLWVKEKRKIFFMPAWINSFVNAHSSREALDVVERFLEKRKDLPIDVRRKILQSLDSLRRAVRVRTKYP